MSRNITMNLLEQKISFMGDEDTTLANLVDVAQIHETQSGMTWEKDELDSKGLKLVLSVTYIKKD